MTKTNYIMAILLNFILIISLFSCTSNSTSPNQKYCGYEMSNKEILKVKSQDQAYKYSDTDMAIQGEISFFAQKIGGDSMTIEVFFFMSTEDELGIYLFGPKDYKIIEKMNCAIINGQYQNKTPKKKYILYYETDEEPLLAGIKSQP